MPGAIFGFLAINMFQCALATDQSPDIGLRRSMDAGGKMRILNALPAALIVVAGTGLFAGSAAAETLHDVLSVVYQSNPTIRAERQRQEATSELYDQALAGALPQINGAATRGRTHLTQTTTAGLFAGNQLSTRTDKLETKSISVEGEQPLFTGFRNYNTIKQAQARISGGASQLQGIEQQILLDAATAFFDVARDMEVYNANASNVNVLRKQLDDSKARFELGDITRTDVLQAEARLAGAQAQLSSAKTQLSISRSRYREIVGNAPGSLEAELALPALPETLDEALDIARVYAPTVEVVRSEADASRRQIQIAQGARLPSVSITASYLQADEPSSFVVDDEQWAYGLRATIPIFQGGLEFSRVREAKALHARDKSRVIAAERSVEAQVTGVWEQLYEAKIRIDAATTQVDANRAALNGVRREAELGARTTLDVLNAEQEFLNSTVALVAAQRDQQVAAYALLAAIGVLAVESSMVEPIQNAALETPAVSGNN